jgi:hypothetical protein
MQKDYSDYNNKRHSPRLKAVILLLLWGLLFFVIYAYASNSDYQTLKAESEVIRY